VVSKIPVSLEMGRRRVFASALDWPGWCRSGRDEQGALAELLAYGERYRAALGTLADGFPQPTHVSAFDVVEHLEGNATTDFGAPGIISESDRRPERADLQRLAGLLEACWDAFDAAVDAAAGAVLRKGPRGGGRDLDAIVAHVREADKSYLARLGVRYRKEEDDDPSAEMNGVRRAILDTLSSFSRGEPPPRTTRARTLWPPPYFVRRSAWHALDHAWEIEDRAETATTEGPG
jgi:hypothetical protein